MNLQTIIDNSRMRDNAVAELCKAIDELDAPAVERVLAYAAERREAFSGNRDPRIKLSGPFGPGFGDKAGHADIVGARLAEAQEAAKKKKTGRATHERRAAKKGAKFTVAGKHPAKPRPTRQSKPMPLTMTRIVTFIANNPALTAIEIGKALGLKGGTVSSHLSTAKKQGRVYNEAGKWHVTQRQKTALNGAATAT